MCPTQENIVLWCAQPSYWWLPVKYIVLLSDCDYHFLIIILLIIITKH